MSRRTFAGRPCQAQGCVEVARQGHWCRAHRKAKQSKRNLKPKPARAASPAP